MQIVNLDIYFLAKLINLRTKLILESFVVVNGLVFDIFHPIWHFWNIERNNLALFFGAKTRLFARWKS